MRTNLQALCCAGIDRRVGRRAYVSIAAHSAIEIEAIGNWRVVAVGARAAATHRQAPHYSSFWFLSDDCDSNFSLLKPPFLCLEKHLSRFLWVH